MDIETIARASGAMPTVAGNHVLYYTFSPDALNAFAQKIFPDDGYEEGQYWLSAGFSSDQLKADQRPNRRAFIDWGIDMIDQSRQAADAISERDKFIGGWRERDWPEGFDRRTAQIIADEYSARFCSDDKG